MNYNYNIDDSVTNGTVGPFLSYIFGGYLIFPTHITTFKLQKVSFISLTEPPSFVHIVNWRNYAVPSRVLLFFFSDEILSSYVRVLNLQTTIVILAYDPNLLFTNSCHVKSNVFYGVFFREELIKIL